jgi:glutamine synthetase
MAHVPGVKGGYFPSSRSIRTNDLRAEMMSVCTEMGLIMEIHHHEVAPAQNELGFRFDTLVKTADKRAEVQVQPCTTSPTATARR